MMGDIGSRFVQVTIESDWWSKINWTQVVGVICQQYRRPDRRQVRCLTCDAGQHRAYHSGGHRDTHGVAPAAQHHDHTNRRRQSGKVVEC